MDNWKIAVQIKETEKSLIVHDSNKIIKAQGCIKCSGEQQIFSYLLFSCHLYYRQKKIFR